MLNNTEFSFYFRFYSRKTIFSLRNIYTFPFSGKNYSQKYKIVLLFMDVFFQPKMILVLWILSIFSRSSLILSLNSQSGFGQIYRGKTYIPLIVESRPFVVREVVSMMSCFYACLNEYDCSLAVFFQNTRQCQIYNLFPLIDREFFPDDQVVILTFQQTIERK